MWQSSATSLRHDVVDVLVDIFADSHKKSASVVRQIKERLKQHSLLVADSSKGQALAFDHEDFQNFFTGERLGRLLGQGLRPDLQTFLSVNLLPGATVEQSVQFLLRQKLDAMKVAKSLIEINQFEASFSFCKENCGALIMRIVECISDRDAPLVLDSMFFSPEALAGRNLQQLIFQACHFQPTSIAKGSFKNVEFKNCEFERLEVGGEQRELQNCTFTKCIIDSIVLTTRDECSFEPAQIAAWLSMAGAEVISASEIHERQATAMDERLKVLERFLRVFLRNTQIDEDIIRRRLGSGAAFLFFEEVLPALLDNCLLEEVPWKGRGTQRRFKLKRQMSDVSEALERAHGSFDEFLSVVRG